MCNFGFDIVSNFQEVGREVSVGSGQRQVTDGFECGNEHPSCIKCRELFELRRPRSFSRRTPSPWR